MQISGSCDPDGSVARDALEGQRLEQLARRLPFTEQDQRTAQDVQQVARDFVSVLYGTLVKEMQNTTERDEGDEGSDEEDEFGDDSDPIADGVRDFMTMFLPRAMASNREDALVKYIAEQINAKRGENVNEQI